MNELLVDLHIHTNFSDGHFSPEEIVKYACESGILAISITDHDSTDGIGPALTAGDKYGVEIIPGVELSCHPENSSDEEIHILGYYIKYEDGNFQEQLKNFRGARLERAREILRKLRALNINVDADELFAKSESRSLGRMHFAKVLFSEGYVNSVKESFDRYLAYGKPAYVPKPHFESPKAIKMILDAGGIPILAHPQVGADNIAVIKKLKEQGLAGIEAYAVKNRAQNTGKYLEWAKKLDLLVTGGSDFHGDTPFGEGAVSYDIVSSLKEYREKYNQK